MAFPNTTKPKDLRVNRFVKGEKTTLGGVLSIALEHVKDCELDYEQTSNGCTTLSPVRQLHYDIKVGVEQHDAAIRLMGLALADDYTFVGIAPLPSADAAQPAANAGSPTPGAVAYSAQALIILKHCEAAPYLLTKTRYAAAAWIKSNIAGSLETNEQAARLRIRADIIEYQLPP
jgi:hypothetical protein